jgi:16S rRNA G966 N2-methylase RsmD
MDINNTSTDINNTSTDINNTSTDINNTSTDINNTSTDINNTSTDINKTNKEYIESLKRDDKLNLQCMPIEEDPWDNAINDNKFIIKNKIMRIFPVLKNCLNYNKLLIDDESFSFITIREIAYLTSKIICIHLSKHDINPLKVDIVDYCAGVGGNVISFSKFFNHVYAVEINKTRAEYLINNLGVYNCKNVTVINNSSIAYNNIGHSLVYGEEGFYHDNPMVVFIDPPWGGNDYKNIDNLKIKLDDIYIEDLVTDILDKFNLLINEYKDYNNRFIVLKLPKNFDIELFYNHINKYPKKNNYIVDLYLYILNKMIIIVCEYNHTLTLSCL